jgi:protein-tyrosine-phosphatase
MNILFVCSANICRSFLAEMLTREEIDAYGLENVSVASAGLFAQPGTPPDPEMVKYLQEMGISVNEHLSRKIEKEDVDWADHILVMEKMHADLIRQTWPEAGEKVEPLGSYISRPEMVDDIIDPYNRTPFHYRLAQSQITMALKAFFQKISRE